MAPASRLLENDQLAMNSDGHALLQPDKSPPHRIFQSCGATFEFQIHPL